MFGEQNTQRPTLPADLSRQDRIRIARYTDLATRIPQPDWDEALAFMPMSEMFEHYGGPKGAYNEMAMRGPDDADWYNGALYNDGEDYGVSTLWVSSWYDLSTAPNLEIVEHIKANASDREVRESQYMIVAPTRHCAMYRLRNPLVVGERNMGDVDFGFDRILWEFLDSYVRGADNGFRENEPKLRYFAMGANEWREDRQWPPESEAVTYYLASSRGANSLAGDGRLVSDRSDVGSEADVFTYDPMNPVPSLGGNLWGSSAGSYDNRAIEARTDVLVYTTEAFEDDVDITGKIEIVLYVSSSARDTDFTVKLLDVYPDGRAMNLDETIQRVRYRDGYDKEVMMRPGEIHELRVSPITTSNVFLAGHSLRVEVSSSNFPRFQRNLNTGGDNFTETEAVTAENRVHHSARYPSRIVVPVVR
jgi:putative CocE/NonD family hydrolase